MKRSISEEAFVSARLARERETVAAMIATYCGGTHARSGSLCSECSDLEAYAGLRLEKCLYGEDKPTCAKCPVHCYQPHRREQVRRVMAYAGPRMLLLHPILAIRHKLDGYRRASGRPPGAGGGKKTL